MPLVTLIEGYGWHCDRRLLWLLVVLASIGSCLLALALEVGIEEGFDVDLPLALPVAFVPLLVLGVRLRRRLGGEPFAVDPPVFSRRLNTVRFIRRAESPRTFAFHVIVESVIWGSGTIVQLALLTATDYFAALD
jgi:hypothetical protein